MTTKSSGITIRTELQPGDIGYVVYRHGRLYSEEYGYGVSFEAYVAGGLYEFYSNYDKSRDGVWIIEDNGIMIGFLLLMHRDKVTAQLRYFFIEKEYRSMGLGMDLMNRLMQFLKEKNYHSCYLLTTSELEAAAGLYTRFGFRLKSETASSLFGKPVTEQRYEWHATER